MGIVFKKPAYLIIDGHDPIKLLDFSVDITAHIIEKPERIILSYDDNNIYTIPRTRRLSLSLSAKNFVYDTSVKLVEDK